MDYVCSFCEYSTDIHSNYKLHLTTNKHKLNCGLCVKSNVSEFKCDKCEKIYTTRAGRFKHSKKCGIKDNSTIQLKDELQKMNKKKIIKLYIESIPLKNNENIPTSTTIINDNSVNTYNNFNLNLFLYKKCINSPNIDEFFVNMALTDEYVDKLLDDGYIGISDIIYDIIGNYPFEDLPLFCVRDSLTDKQTVHVKSNNMWQITDQLDENGFDIKDDVEEDGNNEEFYYRQLTDNRLLSRHIESFTDCVRLTLKKLYANSSNKRAFEKIFKEFDLPVSDLITKQYLIRKRLMNYLVIDKCKLLSIINNA